MSTIRMMTAAALAAGMAAVLMVRTAGLSAQASEIAMDADDIAGTVTGPKGPEAGVWVIAETTDLPTRFARIVVTDERGRYLVPDLPKANYNVWVRGYGLTDSPKVQAAPGRRLDLTAVVAPDPQTAARYYPAGSWFSLLRVPEAGEFPGTGPTGNGINPEITSQAAWLRTVKSGGCLSCHALGTRGTRELPPSLGNFEMSTDAGHRRVQSGQGGGGMMKTPNPPRPKTRPRGLPPREGPLSPGGGP